MRGGNGTPACMAGSRKLLGLSVSRFALSAVIGSAGLAAVSLPVVAQVTTPQYVHERGHNGTTHGDNGTAGGNGHTASYYPSEDFNVNIPSPVHVITVDARRGAGGDGRGGDPNHWGGAGGDGGKVFFSFTGSRLLSTGAGIALLAGGGDGGLAACDCYSQKSGFGGSGGSIMASIGASGTIDIATGYAVLANTSGGDGADAAHRHGAPQNPPGGPGGDAGTINIQHVSGQILARDGPALWLIATGDDGGGGRGDGSRPSGNGGAGNFIMVTATGGSLTTIGDGGHTLHCAPRSDSNRS
jgi:hypothetical protein